MTAGGPMVGFGNKQAWLAIQGTPAPRVLTELGLRDLGPLAWRAGIDLAYLTDDRVVITPPLPGVGGDWTLALGQWLFHSTVDIVDLSGRLATEVQFYATHRVPELHQWQRARHGVLVRAFGYLGQVGEVTDWRGEPDGAELAAHLPPTFSADGDDVVLVGEADVMSVAAAWSLDPNTLDGQPAPGPLTAAAV